jgi:hypothetical protein
MWHFFALADGLLLGRLEDVEERVLGGNYRCQL